VTSLSSPHGGAPRLAVPPGARRPLVAAGVALLVLLIAGLAAPATALHGWLIGFTFAGGVPLGALALLLIHALTGGRWGEAHRPALLALARSLPILAGLVLPLILGSGLAYPWAADPSRAGPDVARWYLNAPAFAIRSLVGLALLGFLAWRLGRGDRPGLLGAGFGLCLYVLFANAAAYDWLLSLAPRFTSSAFGAQVIVAEMLSALCVAVLTSRADSGDPSWSDLGGLMLALTLGESYLVLMSFDIHWYGDRPVQAEWYLPRSLGGWIWLEAAGVVFGAVLPMLALLFGAVRRDPLFLSLAASAILVGLAIEDVWLVSPGTEPLSALAGLVGAVAVACLLVAASRVLAPVMEGHHGD
jgi:hypothetical protein